MAYFTKGLFLKVNKVEITEINLNYWKKNVIVKLFQETGNLPSRLSDVTPSDHFFWSYVNMISKET